MIIPISPDREVRKALACRLALYPRVSATRLTRAAVSDAIRRRSQDPFRIEVTVDEEAPDFAATS